MGSHTQSAGYVRLAEHKIAHAAQVTATSYAHRIGCRYPAEPVVHYLASDVLQHRSLGLSYLRRRLPCRSCPRRAWLTRPVTACTSSAKVALACEAEVLVQHMEQLTVSVASLEPRLAQTAVEIFGLAFDWLVARCVNSWVRLVFSCQMRSLPDSQVGCHTVVPTCFLPETGNFSDQTRCSN